MTLSHNTPKLDKDTANKLPRLQRVTWDTICSHTNIEDEFDCEFDKHHPICHNYDPSEKLKSTDNVTYNFVAQTPTGNSAPQSSVDDSFAPQSSVDDIFAPQPVVDDSAHQSAIRQKSECLVVLEDPRFHNL